MTEIDDLPGRGEDWKPVLIHDLTYHSKVMAAVVHAGLDAPENIAEHAAAFQTLADRAPDNPREPEFSTIVRTLAAMLSAFSHALVIDYGGVQARTERMTAEVWEHVAPAASASAKAVLALVAEHSDPMQLYVVVADKIMHEVPASAFFEAVVTLLHATLHRHNPTGERWVAWHVAGQVLGGALKIATPNDPYSGL